MNNTYKAFTTCLACIEHSVNIVIDDDDDGLFQVRGEG